MEDTVDTQVILPQPKLRSANTRIIGELKENDERMTCLVKLKINT